MLAALVFYVASQRFGTAKAAVFLAGAILWTALIENLSAVAGEYTYYHFSGLIAAQYPGYLFWVGAVPLWILLGWFVLSMSGYIIFHDFLLPNRRAFIQAAASGLLAVNVDLMLDPAASASNLWVWLSGSYRFLGVPVVNFLGLFLLIFFYDLIARHTIFGDLPIPLLGRVESIVFRRLRPNSLGLDLRRFLFRFIIVEVFIFAVLFFLSGFLDMVAASGA